MAIVTKPIPTCCFHKSKSITRSDSGPSFISMGLFSKHNMDQNNCWLISKSVSAKGRIEDQNTAWYGL